MFAEVQSRPADVLCCPGAEVSDARRTDLPIYCGVLPSSSTLDARATGFVQLEVALGHVVISVDHIAVRMLAEMAAVRLIGVEEMRDGK